MRPVYLEIAGLRSFRAKQSLDFADLSLFAVIGDTGAGKSSILEAIVFALYAGSTWDARGGGALMSLDADVMSVVFDFSVGGKRYRAKRIVFRSTRPSEHALTSPDDPECRFQGERQVNAEIRRLVGLDYDTFKKTVVLPQGRFAALLEMSEIDRSKVLTELLGLDEIDRLREKLEPARQEAGGRKRDILAKRGELGANPAAEAALLEAAERAARESLDAMTAARDDLRAKTAERARVAERAHALETVERESAAIVSSARAVRALVPEHERLQAERASLAERAMESKDQLAASSAELGTLEKQRRDGASLAGFASDVKRLRDDASGLRSEEAELEKRERALREEEAALQSAREALDVLRARADAAQDARCKKQNAGVKRRASAARTRATCGVHGRGLAPRLKAPAPSSSRSTRRSAKNRVSEARSKPPSRRLKQSTARLGAPSRRPSAQTAPPPWPTNCTPASRARSAGVRFPTILRRPLLLISWPRGAPVSRPNANATRRARRARTAGLRWPRPRSAAPPAKRR